MQDYAQKTFNFMSHLSFSSTHEQTSAMRKCYVRLDKKQAIDRLALEYFGPQAKKSVRITSIFQI